MVLNFLIQLKERWSRNFVRRRNSVNQWCSNSLNLLDSYRDLHSPEAATAIGGEVSTMRALQAYTSYAVGVGISPVAPPSMASRPRRGLVAKFEPAEKSVELMRKFSEQYARRSGTYFCVDKSVTSVVIKGLAEHKDTLGAPLCPCRHYDDKAVEAEQGFWNCPCIPMRERKECHCMLFLTPDNDFAGQEQDISLEEIKEAAANI